MMLFQRQLKPLKAGATLHPVNGPDYCAVFIDDCDLIYFFVNLFSHNCDYFFEDRLCSSGVFQEGRLDGVGTKQTLEGDVYDGIFVKGELFLGVYHNCLQKEFYFALFDKKEPKKIYCSGKGYPFELQSTAFI